MIQSVKILASKSLENSGFTAVRQTGDGRLVCRYAEYYYKREIEELERGGACGTHGKEQECVQAFGGKT
jgi:hypothetical protein